MTGPSQVLEDFHSSSPDPADRVIISIELVWEDVDLSVLWPFVSLCYSPMWSRSRRPTQKNKIDFRALDTLLRVLRKLGFEIQKSVYGDLMLTN